MTSKRKVRTDAGGSCAWGYSHSVGAVVIIIVVISSSSNSRCRCNIFTRLHNWKSFSKMYSRTLRNKKATSFPNINYKKNKKDYWGNFVSVHTGEIYSQGALTDPAGAKHFSHWSCRSLMPENSKTVQDSVFPLCGSAVLSLNGNTWKGLFNYSGFPQMRLDWYKPLTLMKTKDMEAFCPCANEWMEIHSKLCRKFNIYN